MRRRQASRVRAWSRHACLLALFVLATGMPAFAQAPVGAVFRVLQKGAPIGTVTLSVGPDEDNGWVIQGTSYLGARYSLTVRRFEAHYDSQWSALFATMDLATPAEALLVHTAINGGAARTDLLHDGIADLGTSTVSRDTIVIPDLVYTAYEALAQRLSRANVGELLPVYVLPLREINVRLDSKSDLRVLARNETISAHWWHLTFLTDTRETPAEIWESGGHLLRIEMPTDAISVIRTDITP